LEPEKLGGWSLLPVGAGELEVGASLNVNLDIEENHFMVFSYIGFSHKYWCTMHCVDAFVIVYYAPMNVNVYDTIIY
jgi:hypothetical protein